MSDDGQRRGGDSQGLADVWPWLVFPIAPLLGGFIVLHFLYAPEFTFANTGLALSGFSANFLQSAERSFVHFEGLMVYVSVAGFHVALCVLAVLYFVTKIREFPDSVVQRTWRLVGLLLLILIVTGVAARLDATALQLTYRNTCELLRLAKVATHIVPPDCQGGAPSLLFWLASVPTLAGLTAAVFAAALASSAAGPLPEDSESAWRTAFASRARILQRGFYAISAVLVSGTVSIMLFLQLPVALAADEATKRAVASHANGMTVFWGTIFTLTLIVSLAPSVHLMLKAAERHVADSESPSDVRAWIGQQVFISGPKLLGNVTAFMAPLLVGPVGTLLEKLSGVV